jgi:hypothetical protein
MMTSLDLWGILSDLGLELSSENDRRVFGFCPAHEEYKGRPDSKPSWSMDKELLVHHCWSCPFSGTLRQLIARMEGDTDEVSEWLADYTRRTAVRKLREAGRVREAPKPKAAPPKGLQRRLESFCDPPDWALQARALERFAVVHYGVRWDPELDHWIIPIHDEYGELVGFQRKGDGYFCNRPKGLEKKLCVFGLAQLPKNGWAVVVESPLDVVRLYSEGVEGGVATFGAYVSNHQLDLIHDRADDVVLALDNDETGIAQRNQIWHAQWKKGRRFRCLDYTGIAGKDIGEMTSAEIRRHRVHPILWRPPEPPLRERPQQEPGARFRAWREARLAAQRQS